MNIGIIGSGAREHSICYWIKKSKRVNKIFCFPGNAGTDDIAENINIDLKNFKVLKDFILKNNIKIVILERHTYIVCWVLITYPTFS